MHGPPDALTLLLIPLAPLFQRGSQFYWLTYAGAAMAAAALYALGRKRRFRPRAMLRHLLPARLITHRSTLLDLKLFVLATYFIALQGALLYGTAAFGAEGATRLLGRLLGPGEAAGTPSLAVTAITVTLSFLAIELGYWLAHLAMHRIPALWEFHKVHHSAEVLTPLTEWRQHPVELALFPVVIGAATALVQAPLLHAFGPGAQLIAPASANLIVMAFAFTILHLRHSELPFCATGWRGRLVQSPGHHQIHHSTDPRHFDCNLGFCLSLWDWAFGTLVLPERGARYAFGLGHEDRPLQTATGSLIAPFPRAARCLAGRGEGGAAIPEPAPAIVPR